MANNTIYPYGTEGQLPSGIGLVNDCVTGGADKALTAEAGKRFYDEVFGEAEYTTYTKADATPYYVDGDGNDSNSPVRIRVTFNVLAGDVVTASCSLGKGVACSIYGSLTEAKKGSANYLQTISYSYLSSLEGTVEQDGILCVSLAKSNDSAFSSSEIESYLDALNLSVVRTTRNDGVVVQLREEIQESTVEVVDNFDDGGHDKALSAEAGKTFYDAMLGTVEQVAYTKADATAYKVKNGQIVSSGYVRIRVVISLKKGDTMSASCSLGKGVAASVYASLEDALAAGTNYLQTISYTYESSLSGTLTVDGLLTVTLAKTDDSAFSSSEFTQYMDALVLTGMRTTRGAGAIVLMEEEIDSLRGEIANIDSNKTQEVFLGTLVQKSLTATGLSDTNKNYRVSMASCIVIPREGVTFDFHLPDGYGVGIRHGELANNLSTLNYPYIDGQSFTFPKTSRYFRLNFFQMTAGGDLNTIQTSVADVNALLASGGISVTIPYEQGIIEQNRENEKYIKAVMRNWVSGIANNYSLTKLPIFAHTSDVHGDANRFKRFMDYCDFLGVDAALVTGDTVAIDPSQSMQYVNDIADEHSTPALLCMGNHDARNLTTAQAQNETILGYLITKNGVTTNPNETYPTYYYKDFATKQIRVISINLYELSHSSDNANFTQTQCEWLISALASTPANYGVFILFHSPEARPSKDNSHATFYQDLLNWTGYQANLTGNVFRKIIDAFIGKTSESITYKVGSTNITVSADFTSVASGVEFIAYVNGHLHTDLVGYTPDAVHLQLNLNVNCGVAVYGDSYQGLANLSDLPRGCVGATQDCFNIYAIDRTAKTVRIAKVGSNVTGNLVDRKFMSIPYAD